MSGVIKNTKQKKTLPIKSAKAAKADAKKPKAAKADAKKPKAAKEDAKKPKAAKTDSKKPKAAKTDSKKPKAAKADAKKPKAAKADAKKPKAAKADDKKPKAPKADAKKPKAAKADDKKPKADAKKPKADDKKPKEDAKKPKADKAAKADAKKPKEDAKKPKKDAKKPKASKADSKKPKAPKADTKKPIKAAKAAKVLLKKVMIGALTDQTVLLNNQSQLTKLKIQDQKFEDTDQQKKGYSHIVSTDVISYDMLVEQFFDELLIDEYIKLEDNAEEIAEGIADKIAVDIAKEFADNNSDTLELKIKKYRDALYETTDETNQLRRKLLGFWNETVKSKINECKENILRPNEQDKETLRNNLLSILYKLRAINEYEKTLSGIITTPEAIEKSAIKTEAIKTEAIKYSIEYILNIKNNESFNYDLMPPIPKTLIYTGGAPKGARLTSPGAVRHITVPPPVQENFLMFCLNKWVKKMWKYLITLMEEPKLLIFDSSYRYSVDQRRYDIREKIREELKNKGVNINIVDKDFHIVDNDEQFRLKVAESQFYREQLDLAIQTAMEDHNSLATLLQIYPHTEWRGIYKPFKQLKIYGVDLPIQYNRGMLLGKMFYIVKNITTFVDLQDCENVSNRIFKVKVDGEYIYNGCNPYDRSVEREMFELACVVMKDKGIISNYSDKKFLNIKGYVDMTSGSYSAWDEISKIEDTTTNTTLIHCYAGKGRTGSVILFLILRDAKIYETKKLYDLGSQYTDPLVLIGELKNLFDISKSGEDNPGNYISYVVEEVFNTKKIWHIILLRQRLNRIFYFLAKHNNKKVFYLYADVAPRSDVYSEIVADERKKDKTLTDKDIQDIAYQKYISRKSEDEDITHEFSKPSKLTIDWGNIDESKIAQHKKYIDGYLT